MAAAKPGIEPLDRRQGPGRRGVRHAGIAAFGEEGAHVPGLEPRERVHRHLAALMAGDKGEKA